MHGRSHRNSQKRVCEDNLVYFITTNTHERFPYFKEDIFCELFIDNLKVCKKLKRFKLYGFVILPNHVHLLIEPGGKYNISKVMASLKKIVCQRF
jgi:putative transposase